MTTIFPEFLSSSQSARETAILADSLALGQFLFSGWENIQKIKQNVNFFFYMGKNNDKSCLPRELYESFA